jgi:hypothetical protein
MDKGEIIEQGDHGTLIAKAGLYRRLYDLQFNEVDLVESPFGLRMTSDLPSMGNY